MENIKDVNENVIYIEGIGYIGYIEELKELQEKFKEKEKWQNDFIKNFSDKQKKSVFNNLNIKQKKEIFGNHDLGNIDKFIDNLSEDLINILICSLSAKQTSYVSRSCDELFNPDYLLKHEQLQDKYDKNSKIRATEEDINDLKDGTVLISREDTIKNLVKNALANQEEPSKGIFQKTLDFIEQQKAKIIVGTALSIVTLVSSVLIYKDLEKNMQIRETSRIAGTVNENTYHTVSRDENGELQNIMWYDHEGIANTIIELSREMPEYTKNFIYLTETSMGDYAYNSQNNMDRVFYYLTSSEDPQIINATQEYINEKNNDPSKFANRMENETYEASNAMIEGVATLSAKNQSSGRSK